MNGSFSTSEVDPCWSHQQFIGDLNDFVGVGEKLDREIERLDRRIANLTELEFDDHIYDI